VTSSTLRSLNVFRDPDPTVDWTVPIPDIRHCAGPTGQKLKSLRVMPRTLVDDDDFESRIGVHLEEITQGVAQRLVTVQGTDDDGTATEDRLPA
jgi:hypothetical protein